jgi:DNA-binding NarL/FixJ family response regulator
VVGVEGAVMVALNRLTPSPPDPSALAERFGLTRQEVRVAFLLAEGKKDAEIARALCISWHTARRHVERALHKLGVHSRAAVAATIGRAQAVPHGTVR